MELELVRKELNYYDELIKNIINLRMALIPIVADVKIKNNLPLFQGKREDEIYKKIDMFSKENGIDCNLLTSIYKLIIQNALQIEEKISEDNNISVINNNNLNVEEIVQEFKNLDEIIQVKIPNIISKIKSKSKNMNINQIATLYYYDKINKKEKNDV